MIQKYSESLVKPFRISLTEQQVLSAILMNDEWNDMSFLWTDHKVPQSK